MVNYCEKKKKGKQNKVVLEHFTEKDRLKDK